MLLSAPEPVALEHPLVRSQVVPGEQEGKEHFPGVTLVLAPAPQPLPADSC